MRRLPGLCYSARSHRGPDGHPPRLSYRPVRGVHHQRSAHSSGGVVRLQEHQTVSPVLGDHSNAPSTFDRGSVSFPLSPLSCANDTSSWVPLPVNSTEVTMDSRFDEDNNLETQVIFGHLENTLAVRCLARNEMAAVSREIKLVSNGKFKNNSWSSQVSSRGVVVGFSGYPSTPDTRSVMVFEESGASVVAAVS